MTFKSLVSVLAIATVASGAAVTDPNFWKSNKDNQAKKVKPWDQEGGGKSGVYVNGQHAPQLGASFSLKGGDGAKKGGSSDSVVARGKKKDTEAIFQALPLSSTSSSTSSLLSTRASETSSFASAVRVVIPTSNAVTASTPTTSETSTDLPDVGDQLDYMYDGSWRSVIPFRWHAVPSSVAEAEYFSNLQTQTVGSDYTPTMANIKKHSKTAAAVTTISATTTAARVASALSAEITEDPEEAVVMTMNGLPKPSFYVNKYGDVFVDNDEEYYPDGYAETFYLDLATAYTKEPARWKTIMTNYVNTEPTPTPKDWGTSSIPSWAKGLKVLVKTSSIPARATSAYSSSTQKESSSKRVLTSSTSHVNPVLSTSRVRSFSSTTPTATSTRGLAGVSLKNSILSRTAPATIRSTPTTPAPGSSIRTTTSSGRRTPTSTRTRTRSIRRTRRPDARQTVQREQPVASPSTTPQSPALPTITSVAQRPDDIIASRLAEQRVQPASRLSSIRHDYFKVSTFVKSPITAAPASTAQILVESTTVAAPTVTSKAVKNYFIGKNGAQTGTAQNVDIGPLQTSAPLFEPQTKTWVNPHVELNTDTGAIRTVGVYPQPPVAMKLCGGQPFHENDYHCWNDMFLCPIIQQTGEILHFCNGHCYSKKMYKCIDNNLFHIDAVVRE